MVGRSTHSPPRVVVWRNTVLPASNTFIANQTAALSEWRPVFAGLASEPNPFGVSPALTVDGRSRRLFEQTGWDPGLHRLLRGPEVRLVHAHFGTDATFVARAARLARRPLVVTFHGYDVTTRPEQFRRVVRRRWQRMLESADLLLAVSDFVREQLLARGALDSKVLVHHIGIPVPELTTAPAREPRVCFVGRLVEKKGVADLLQAVAQLRVPVPVDVVGDGPLRDQLQQLADQLRVRATFHGSLPPDQVRDHLRRSSVFCGPSKRASSGDREGFGMVFLEAAAQELPCVTYRSGGAGEAVADGQTGLVVEEGDVRALSQALQRLLDDEDLAARLGRAGRTRVEQHYDVRAQSRALEQLYADVVARRR